MINTVINIQISNLMVLKTGKQSRYLLFLWLMIASFASLNANPVFMHENRDPVDSEYESTILCLVDDKEVGHICIRKLPLFHFYVLHTLYVHPEHRLHGYGRQLVDFACNYLISQDASRIYIQPGPFELDHEGKLVRPLSNYETREKGLIALYTKCGFVGAGMSLRACAYLLYSCMGINENPKHLMVRTIDQP